MKRHIKCIVFILLVAGWGCTKKESGLTQPLMSTYDLMVETIVDSLTLEEKVAQLFIVEPKALLNDEEYEILVMEDTLLNALNTYPVGGFILMDENLESDDQLKRLLNSFQENSYHRFGLPSFLSIDEEGGLLSQML